MLYRIKVDEKTKNRIVEKVERVDPDGIGETSV